MIIIRILLLSSLLSMAFMANLHADIVSWVDSNGVRHFSNVDASQKNDAVKSVEEYKPDNTARNPEPKSRTHNPYKVINGQDSFYQKEIERQKQSEEISAQKERLRTKREREANEKAARDRSQNCNKAKKELERLKQAGWKSYNSPSVIQVSCPDRVWTDGRGIVRDNMRECTARRNQARINAYEQDIGQKEYRIKMFCGQ